MVITPANAAGPTTALAIVAAKRMPHVRGPASSIGRNGSITSTAADVAAAALATLNHSLIGAIRW